jgi:hypothetical protein
LKLLAVVLQVEVEVGIGVLDEKHRHVEEEIRVRVEGEEGVVVVGKKIGKTKHLASIEDHAHPDDLKKDEFSFQNRSAIIIQGERKRQVQNKEKNYTL